MIGSSALLLWASLALAAPDRSAPPPVSPAAPLDHPGATWSMPRPGLQVAWVPVQGVTRTAIFIRFEAGALALDGAETPRTDALDSLWLEATEDLDRVALSETERLLDLDLSVSVDADEVQLEASFPAGAWREALEVVDGVLHRPDIPADAVKTEARDTLRWWTVLAPSDIGAAAELALHWRWYPSSHPLGLRPDLKAIKKLKHKDLEALARSLPGRGRVDVVVVGDVDPARDGATLYALLADLPADVDRDAGPVAPRAPQQAETVAVHVDGVSQAAVRVRLAAPPLDHADSEAFDAAQWLLGGHFLSRLNANLREDKGWTYGGYGRWSDQRTHGTWTFSVDVPADKVAEARREIERELERFLADGPTEEELAAWRTNRIADWNTRLATSEAAANAWIRTASRDRTLPDERARLDKALALDAVTVRGAARAWLDPRRAVTVVAGDRAVLEQELEGVTFLDAEDAVMGRLGGDRP